LEDGKVFGQLAGSRAVTKQAVLTVAVLGTWCREGYGEEAGAWDE